MATYFVAPTRRRQYMPLLATHIVALKQILSMATIYADIDTFVRPMGRQNVR